MHLHLPKISLAIGKKKGLQWIWLQHTAPSFSKSLQSFNILDDSLCPRLAPTRCSNLQGDVQRAKFANLSWCPDPLQQVQRCSTQIDLHVYWKWISIWQVLLNSFEGAICSTNASMIQLIRRCVARHTLWPNVGAWLRPIGGGQGLGFAVIQTRQNLGFAQPGECNITEHASFLASIGWTIPCVPNLLEVKTLMLQRARRKHTVLHFAVLCILSWYELMSSNFWSTEWSHDVSRFLYLSPVANQFWWLGSFHSTNLEHQCHRRDQSHSSCLLWERLACTKWCPWFFVFHMSFITDHSHKICHSGSCINIFWLNVFWGEARTAFKIVQSKISNQLKVAIPVREDSGGLDNPASQLYPVCLLGAVWQRPKNWQTGPQRNKKALS